MGATYMLPCCATHRIGHFHQLLYFTCVEVYIDILSSNRITFRSDIFMMFIVVCHCEKFVFSSILHWLILISSPIFECTEFCINQMSHRFDQFVKGKQQINNCNNSIRTHQKAIYTLICYLRGLFINTALWLLLNTSLHIIHLHIDKLTLMCILLISILQLFYKRIQWEMLSVWSVNNYKVKLLKHKITPLPGFTQNEV